MLYTRLDGAMRGHYSEWGMERMGRVFDSFFSEFVVVWEKGRSRCEN